MSDIGFGKKFRFRQCCPLQYQAVDAGRLVFHLIQQTWRIGFQFETVGGLDQRDFLPGHDILCCDVLADDGKHFGSRQLLAFPLLDLLVGGIFGWLLVTEFRDKSRRLVDMPVQTCVGFQLVHILGELVLELLQLFLVYPVGFTHQVKTQTMLHITGLHDALFQFLHRDKLVGIVGLHPYMPGMPQEYHDLRVEVIHADRCESMGCEPALPDKGKLIVDARYPAFLPELALHERRRDDNHQDARRIEQGIGLIHVILL